MTKKLTDHDKKYLMVICILGLGVLLLVFLLIKMLFKYNYRIYERPYSFVSSEQYIDCESMGIYYSCYITYFNTIDDGLSECKIKERHIKVPEVRRAEIYYNTKKDCSLEQKRYVARRDEVKNVDQINYELYEGFICFGIFILLFFIGHFIYEIKR